MQFIFRFFNVYTLILICSSMLMVSKVAGVSGLQTRCSEMELSHVAASLGVLGSASNLFAVIAVRAYTLEFSNSLFYFSHHEGDHLSSCLRFPQPLVSGLSQSAHKHTHIHSWTQTQHGSIFVWDTSALIHHTFVQLTSPGSSRGHERGFMRCCWGWPQRCHIKGKSCLNNEIKMTLKFPEIEVPSPTPHTARKLAFLSFNI